MNSSSRILVVEDQRLYAQALSFFLEDNGFSTVMAVNGLQAMIELQRQSFDLILLDVNMPGLDGYDVCAAIKSDPRFTSIPVVFLTSEDDPESVATGCGVGGSDYLSKGMKTDEMLARITAQLPHAVA